MIIMQIPIKEIAVKCLDYEDISKVSLIFLSYGYYWRHEETIIPNTDNNFPFYLCISNVNLNDIHREKNGRISLSETTDYANRNNLTIISVKDFIDTY